jgi:Ca2+-binding RTX toxin-like protein
MLQRPIKRRRAAIESLEARAMLTATLADGVLNIVGTDQPDAIRVGIAGAEVRVLVNGVQSSFGIANVRSVNIAGHAGDDTIRIATDIIFSTLINGGDGNDRITGGGGRDVIHGGSGDDVISGGDNRDTLNGDAGADIIYGGKDIDRLNGGTENDLLIGGDGLDRLNGGRGTNELVQAGANDIYSYRSFYVANALVHHIQPDRPNGKTVIMVPGLNLSSSIYLETPDGRDGWAQELANEGYSVYVINDPNFDFSRGFHVEGFKTVPVEGAPAADPSATQGWASQDIWRRWGFGSSEGTPYADTRFPTAHFDKFELSYPYVSRAGRSFTDSIVALMDSVGPSILIAHSAGGPKAVGAALARPQLTQGIVLVEPTGPPTASDFPTLSGISMLGIYGDYIDSRSQGSRKEATEAAAQLFSQNGGVGEVISLPEDLSIYGNTHLMMQDNNSKFIANLMIDWIALHARL